MTTRIHAFCTCPISPLLTPLLTPPHPTPCPRITPALALPPGLRLAPDPEDLRKFVEAASSMDGLHIAELLRGKMVGRGRGQGGGGRGACLAEPVNG